MEKITDEKDIITLHSISELAEFLKKNEGSIISVQIEPNEGVKPQKQGGDGIG